MKIGALIPIRLASERLPRKAIMTICDRPIVHHLLDRIAACRHIDDAKNIVVCTTTDSSDDEL
ncbi:MAG TPA: acylneuraminate cytidylyltransferase, partial [Rhodospirillaceae bacterium]|nr:acylneuraminate cytidylyltransferase [Rhodospirillaceae bacterium]